MTEQKRVEFMSGAQRESGEIRYCDLDMEFINAFGDMQFTTREMNTDTVIRDLMNLGHLGEYPDISILTGAADLLTKLSGHTPMDAAMMIVETFHHGESKYGRDNWKMGLPLSNCINHAIEHIRQWRADDHSEPHLAHALTNIYMAWWFVKNEVFVEEIQKEQEIEETLKS